MIQPCVIDSSIGIAWVHPGQATPETDQLLSDCTHGATMIVPMLWFVELANTLLTLQRRGRITSADRTSALKILEQFPLQIDEQSGKAAFHEVSLLAEKHNLTAYDATYLELALRHNTALATRDLQLRQAAKTAGVKTF